MENQGALCPSAPLYAGSRLLGIVNGEGEVDILETPLTLDDGFIEAASQGRPPEQRFRFVNKCVKSGCKQWDGQACGVIKNVLEKVEEQYWKSELPGCNVRSSCRWFAQEGKSACQVCPLVRYAY